MISSGSASGPTGGTLAQVLGTPIPVARAVAITGSLCEALASQQREGRYAGSLEPAGIALSPEDRVAAVTPPASGAVTHTAAPYTAPEVAQKGAPGAAADVYSAAALLYHLLCGRPPFSGASAQAVLVRQALEPVRPLRQPGVSAAVEAVVRRALSKDPAERPSGPSQFRQELEAALAAGPPAQEPGAGSAAGPLEHPVAAAMAPVPMEGPAAASSTGMATQAGPAPAYRASSMARSSRKVPFIAAGAVLVIGIGFFLFTGMRGREPMSPRLAPSPPVAAVSEVPQEVKAQAKSTQSHPRHSDGNYLIGDSLGGGGTGEGTIGLGNLGTIGKGGGKPGGGKYGAGSASSAPQRSESAEPHHHRHAATLAKGARRTIDPLAFDGEIAAPESEPRSGTAAPHRESSKKKKLAKSGPRPHAPPHGKENESAQGAAPPRIQGAAPPPAQAAALPHGKENESAQGAAPPRIQAAAPPPTQAAAPPPAKAGRGNEPSEGSAPIATISGEKGKGAAEVLHPNLLGGGDGTPVLAERRPTRPGLPVAVGLSVLAMLAALSIGGAVSMYRRRKREQPPGLDPGQAILFTPEPEDGTLMMLPPSDMGPVPLDVAYPAGGTSAMADGATAQDTGPTISGAPGLHVSQPTTLTHGDDGSGDFDPFMVGAYRCFARLGEGGMGMVYKAEHVALSRISAVKVLLPQAAWHSDTVARFRREARLASSINHPNSVFIYDYGEAGSHLFFLAMEFIAGSSLADVLSPKGRPSQPLGLDRVLHITRQICGALGAAHQSGIVHRDLKPQNVMLCQRAAEHDYVKVVDFGIARSLDAPAADQTLTGAVLGTPAYMSPEQANGASDVDARSDIFSLALMVYRMLAGDLPFRKEGMTPIQQVIARAMLSQPPPPIRKLRPDLGIPAGVEAALQRALTPDRQQRTATAAQFLNELSAA